MSFYGDIKRVDSSPYVFDRYYPNRTIMEANAASDGVYIGRFVLVKYTCGYVEDDTNNLTYFNSKNGQFNPVSLTSSTYEENRYYIKKSGEFIKATGDFNSSTNYYKLVYSVTTAYNKNEKTDINNYKDTYDATVWQKIYSLNEEKYIMIAELNAESPRLEFKTIPPKTAKKSGGKLIETWNSPSVEASTDDIFLLNIPDILKLEVNNINENFYGKTLIANPAIKENYEDFSSLPNSPPANSGITDDKWANYTDEQKRHALALSPIYNYMNWTSTYQGEEVTTPGPIDGKMLDTKLYAFGQIISDLYDALYGVPSTGTGPRPFFTDKSIAEVLGLYDKGLVGILSSIATEAKGDASKDLYGRNLNPGQYYYFISKWCSANEDPDNFIENIPSVIGASNGSAAKSDYYIDFKGIYKEIILTASSYQENKYYIKSGNTYSLATGAFDSDITYYEKTNEYIRKFE